MRIDTSLLRATLAAAVAVLAFVGCDPQRAAKLEEGVSTEADVRKQFGEPVTVTVEADGTRVLDYPRQPAGWTNYVIRIGPDGKMSSLRQLLNDDNFSRVRPGMSSQEVSKLLGRPAKTQRFDLRQQDVWDWRYKPQGQESKLFSVTFDSAGQVVGTAVGEDGREIAN